MMTLFAKLFFNHWERKCVSFLLAVVVWFVVSHLQTVSKTIEDVPVRVINVPSGMTVEGLQPTGLLSRTVSLTLTGKKAQLMELAPGDIEAVVDATDKREFWQAPITKSNLISLNPDIDLNKAVVRVSSSPLPMQLIQMVTEKIPVVITSPIGEAPRGYQFIDIWPYHFSATVNGPEQVIKQLKAKGVNLSFNLNHLTKAELDALQDEKGADEVSFYVPDEWKKITIPALGNAEFEIDDPQAKYLKIDFVRDELHPIDKAIPVSIFYPAEYALAEGAKEYTLLPSSLIQKNHAHAFIQKNLKAKGASRLFIELVQNMIEISLIASDKFPLEWSVQFVNPRILEDKYVSLYLSDPSQEVEDIAFVKKREEHLRNRFRSYMNRFQLFTSRDTRLDFTTTLQGDHELILEEKP